MKPSTDKQNQIDYDGQYEADDVRESYKDTEEEDFEDFESHC